MAGAIFHMDMACPGMEDNAGHTLAIFLVKECENAAELRSSLLQGGSGLPEVALMDASMILDPAIVHAAAGMAWQQHISPTQKIKTRTLHSELVFSLSGSKNIGRSLAIFGIKDSTRHLLVAMFDASPENVDVLIKAIKGRVVMEEDMIRSELKNICDEEAICMAYKISSIELEVGSITDAILCRIASRDCL